MTSDNDDLHPMFQDMLGRSDGWTENVNESSLDYNFMTRHPTMSILFIVFSSAIVLTGTIGNIMVIGAVLCYKHLHRNRGILFVVNLAIADLCITCIVCPMNMVGVIKGSRFFLDKVELCGILGSICTVSCIVSMLSIAALAVNRAIQTCMHFSYEEIFTRKRTVRYCICLWLLTILVDLPNWVGIGGHTFALKEMGCTFDRIANYTYTVFLAVLTIAMPMAIVLISYIAIVCFMRNLGEEYEKYFGSLPAYRKREERQFVITLFVAFLGFVLCWSVYMVAMVIDRHDIWPKQVYVFGTLLGHSNSALNPIIYAALNNRLKRGYIVFLKTLCCRKITKEPLDPACRFNSKYRPRAKSPNAGDNTTRRSIGNRVTVDEPEVSTKL